MAKSHVDRLKLFAGLMALLFASVSLLSGQLRDQVTVDATRQLAPPMRGRGPFPGSATPGHSADLPIRLDLVIPTGELTPDGTVLIDFRITNIGSELITLPVSIDQGSFLPQPPDTDFTLDILTLWLTGPEAIKEEYLAGYLGDPKYGRLYKSESPLTSAELYGRSDNPQSFHALAPNQSLVVHASSRVGLKAGIHLLTAHAELAREFIGSNNTSPPSRHQTGKLIGTADSESQRKMLSTASPTAR
jgi:hypothetical protein